MLHFALFFTSVVLFGIIHTKRLKVLAIVGD